MHYSRFLIWKANLSILIESFKIEFILNSFASFQVLVSTTFLQKIILAAFTTISNSRSFARNIAGLLMLPLSVFAVSHFQLCAIWLLFTTFSSFLFLRISLSQSRSYWCCFFKQSKLMLSRPATVFTIFRGQLWFCFTLILLAMN